MITALHTLVYAEDPAAARDFFRDVLRFPATDTGGGWLIFRTGPSELGVHPSTWDHGGEGGAGRRHGPAVRPVPASATTSRRPWPSSRSAAPSSRAA